MKRLIYGALLLCMLAFMVFPLPLRAADTGVPKNPEDMLSIEEIAYVTVLKTLDIAARGQIADLKGQLSRANPADDDWGASLHGGFLALVDTIAMFNMGVPADFTEVRKPSAELAGYYAGLNSSSMSDSALFGFNKSGGLDLLTFARELSAFETILGRTLGILNDLQSALDDAVDRLARERAKAYNFYGGLFGCSEST